MVRHRLETATKVAVEPVVATSSHAKVIARIAQAAAVSPGPAREQLKAHPIPVSASKLQNGELHSSNHDEHTTL